MSHKFKVIEKDNKKYLLYEGQLFQLDKEYENMSMDMHLFYLTEFAEICKEYCKDPNVVEQYAEIMLHHIQKIKDIRDQAIVQMKNPDSPNFNPDTLEYCNMIHDENKYLFEHRKTMCPPNMDELGMEHCGPNSKDNLNCHACWHRAFLRLKQKSSLME